MQEVDFQNIVSRFKKKFFWLILISLFLITITSWVILFSSYKTRIRFSIDQTALTIEKTFQYIRYNQGISAAQMYLSFIRKEFKTVELVVFYDLSANQVTASTESGWVGKRLSDLPEKNIQDDIEKALMTKSTHYGVHEHEDVFDLTVYEKNSVFIIHLEKKALLHRFFYSSIFSLIVVSMSFLAIILFSFCIMFPRLFYPFRRKFRDIVLSSSLYLGKFKSVVEPNGSFSKGLFSFIQELKSDFDQAAIHQAWVSHLFEQLPTGLMIADGEGKVIFINQKMTELLGIFSDQALGTGWSDAIYPEDYDKALRIWTESLKEQKKQECQFRFRTPDGLLNWVQAHLSPIYDLQGQSIGMIGSFIPINQYKHFESDKRFGQREQELAFERKTTDLISIISHQLRTPLSIIQEAVNIIEIACKDDNKEEVERFLPICQNNIHKIINMIRDILAYEEIEFGYKKWKKERIKTVEFVRNIYDHYKDKFINKKIEYLFEAPEHMSDLFVDIKGFARVIDNLISNALIFTEKGKVIIRLLEIDGAILLEVQDSGIGIREKDFPRLFTLFSQVHSSNMRFGSGLGLVIVKKIVEYHGGEVSAESKFGEGSVFRVKMPIEEKHG